MAAIRVFTLHMKNGAEVKFHAEACTVTRDPTSGAVTNLVPQAVNGGIRLRGVVFSEIAAVTDEPLRPPVALDTVLRSDPDLE